MRAGNAIQPSCPSKFRAALLVEREEAERAAGYVDRVRALRNQPAPERSTTSLAERRTYALLHLVPPSTP
jgi:hypothetical protein